ncbi:MAG: DUF3592 domain-containing protein [Chloroflexota bacterium]|jgi:hypothetical protein
MMTYSVMIGLLCLGGVFVLFAGLGVFFIVRHQRDTKKAEQSVSWPSVAGTVTAAQVKTHHSTDSEGDPSETYSAQVEYQYEVNGVAYTGDRLTIGTPLAISNLRKVQESVAQFPVGSRVTVYFNPQNPAEATLQTRVGGKAGLVLGIIFLLIGISVGCIGVGGILLSFLEL